MGDKLQPRSWVPCVERRSQRPQDVAHTHLCGQAPQGLQRWESHPHPTTHKQRVGFLKEN